jgi:DNA-binding LacI/PurR family transcriptional regulator
MKKSDEPASGLTGSRPQGKKKKHSFKDLARIAGVSVATVSRVARGHANVDAEIQRKVRQTAEELGLNLENESHQRSTIVAFMLSNRDVHHTFQSLVLLGTEAFCAAHERGLLFLSSHYPMTAPASELYLPGVLKHRTLVRGVILSGTNTAEMLSCLKTQKLPFSVLGNNVIGNWDPEDYNAVFSDDVQGASDLTSQLISDGHRDIWFIGDLSLPWYRRCADGYQRAMQSAGLTPHFSEIHSTDRELGYLATRSILSRNEPVTAVFAGSDQIARGVYEALRQAGLSVPDDVSVAGFNDTEGALMDPPLTSVREFPEELGQHLAEVLLKQLEDPARAPQQLTIPTRVVMRKSTRSIVGAPLSPDSSLGRLRPKHKGQRTC